MHWNWNNFICSYPQLPSFKNHISEVYQFDMSTLSNMRQSFLEHIKSLFQM